MTYPGERENLPRFAELDGDYEILKELGRGGTAVVYLAHERVLNRHVAIKVIRSTYVEDEDAVARLMREARTVGAMQHPNIVVLYGTRRLGDGSLALIMQYVPGRTLRQEIQISGGLSFDRVHRVLTDLCRALAYAHRQLIVHRDIKPENIYVDDESGIARLSDFGIARSWGAESDLTLPGTAIGTPAYMSPEQIDGGEIDGRSDLYSLGLVGYEMLTGTRPWAGESLYGMIAKQKNTQLPSLAERRPGIPATLQIAIEGAVRKSPSGRWQTANDFLAALGIAPEAERVEEPRSSPFAELLAIESVEESSTRAEVTTPAPAPHSRDSETIVWRPPVAAAVEPPVDVSPIAETAAADETQLPAERLRPRKARGRAALVAAGVLLAVAMAAAAVSLTLGQGAEKQRQAALPDAGPAVAAPVTESLAVPAPPPAAEIAQPDPDVAPPATAADTSAPAAPSRAALVYVVFGDGQQGSAGVVLPRPLMVRVVDAGGRAVEGATVRFAVTAGDGSVQPTLGVTNQDGVAATRWLPRTVGIHRAQARVDGLAGAPLAFRARALPGPAASARASSAADARRAPVRTYAPGQRAPAPFTPSRPTSAESPLGGGARSLPARREVAAGGRHTCALNGTGMAVCWGSSDAGQLGGRPSGPAASVRVAADEPFAGIAAGMTHTCAVAASGRAFCWGGNAAGQLGDGTRVSRSLPERVRLSDRLTAVTVGLQHTCALDATGRLSCWGQNNRGQLGDRTTADRSLAVRVAGGGTFRSVAAGWTHTCGVAADGAAYCWGSNRSGELGNGGSADQAAPVAVAGNHRFTTISAGHRFTCALRADGAVLCWGDNSHGQLGNGTTTTSPTPVEILAADRFVDVAAGGSHACGITWDGTAYCWGQNTYGQLGDGSVQHRLSPSAVAGGNRFTAITASAAHSCGTVSGGRSFCWGSNRDGQVGDGPRNLQSRPVAVSDRHGGA